MQTTQFIELKRARLPNGLECLTPELPKELQEPTARDWLYALRVFAAMTAALVLLQQIIPA